MHTDVIHIHHSLCFLFWANWWSWRLFFYSDDFNRLRFTELIIEIKNKDTEPKKIMMRYGAEDFNYTFVSSTEEGAVVGEGASTDTEDPLRRSSLAGDVSSKPYVYSTPKSMVVSTLAPVRKQQWQYQRVIRKMVTTLAREEGKLQLFRVWGHAAAVFLSCW